METTTKKLPNQHKGKKQPTIRNSNSSVKADPRKQHKETIHPIVKAHGQQH